MTPLRKAAATLAALATAATALVAGPGTAAARPAPAQAIALNGAHFTVNVGTCRGVVKAVAYTDRVRPGRITFRLTPGRFTRPCTIRPWVAWDFVQPNAVRVPMRVGPRGGAPVTTSVRIGSGPHAISAGHRASLTAVTYYVLVP